MRNRSAKLLTKSKFMAGLQCPRYLWVYVNEPQRIPQPDMVTQHTFDQGHEVGDIAKRLYPGGIDMAGLGFREMLTETKVRLDDRKPIFEAAFQSGQLYARIDILNPSDNGAWDIIEVKSSTSVKDENIADVAFQRYVCGQSGIEVNRCFLTHINRDFVKQGDIDPAALLVTEDITEDVLELAGGMSDMVEGMLETMAGPCPAPSIGRACGAPYDCPLKDECWAVLPEHPVTDLYRIGAKMDDLLHSGVCAIIDIPADFKLNEKQLIQRGCVECGQPHVDFDGVTSFLETLKYPHYYLDFETFAMAIPLFDGTRPYQNIPFQFSLHSVNGPGIEPLHHHFLAQGGDDPRPAFLAALRTMLGEGGCVIVYNQSFEEGVLRKLGEAFPEYIDWVNDVVTRMVDLIVPFRAFHYYHPVQRGSASLKYVLPALTGISYKDLNISNGQVASLRFVAAAFGGMAEAEKMQIFNDLLVYCGQDTLGMVRIVERLSALVK
ncbi:hypothetical protein DGWBC_1177 [Dehalogenimonas sp. WBC-2]|nr:hypothetical protein DGWBC_1177 [Dehalogenimonas sp. WBC-2]